MDPDDLAPDPVRQFRLWLDEAEETCPLAAAMTLATATRQGEPSARIVLLRSVDEHGFVFFSNRDSRKGRELAANPRAALVFHWWELGRQVRVEGLVEEIDDAASEEYWRTRARGSQIAAWASRQSDALADRRELDDLFARTAASFAGEDVPLPPFWGGYRVRPKALEFWLHREDRLHDRVRYMRSGGKWRRERLAP